MKKLVSLFLLLMMGAPAMAGYSQPGGVKEKVCYKEVYREEYIPGTRDNPGRVRRWTETKKIPCRKRPRHNTNRRDDRPYRPVDDNSCIEGSVLGGIAGAAAGAALSREEGMIIGIPLGIVGGALVGCQIDGG